MPEPARPARSPKRRRHAASDGPDPIDVEVGARIRLRRKELGVSQMALAESLDLSFQQIQKYERGVNRVSASMLVKTARRLDCSVSHLIGEAPGDVFEDPVLASLGIAGAREVLLAYAASSSKRRQALLRLAESLGRGS